MSEAPRDGTLILVQTLAPNVASYDVDEVFIETLYWYTEPMSPEDDEGDPAWLGQWLTSDNHVYCDVYRDDALNEENSFVGWMPRPGGVAEAELAALKYQHLELLAKIAVAEAALRVEEDLPAP